MRDSDSYYRDQYSDTQRSGVQGWGNSLIDRLIERECDRSPGDRILEIGAASGEHLHWADRTIPWGEYVALDLRPGETNPSLARALEISSAVRFQRGSAEEIPFPDGSFDVCLSTCVLAHVSDPEAVFRELRRVTKVGGNITVGMPCDPGVVNRIVKALVTYPTMKRAGIADPRLQYAREHINGIGNLIALAEHVFAQDATRLRYFPLPVRSWNLNLAVVLHVTIRPEQAAP